MNSKLPAKAPERRRLRGRPPKFGRPARLVAVTLPTDVVAWLEALHPDIGRAIVRLHDEALHRDPRPAPMKAPAAELVDVGESRSLIVVDPALVRGLSGVAAISFGEGRAFLALEPHWTMADLELSVLDALERGPADNGRSRALAAFRDQLREWRTDEAMTMEPRAIIVAGRRSAKRRNRQSSR
jgi:hypothetical protein